mmetsp:Transcript_15464/g.46676  ORF Transcript_15464/g.46676 Transcript_15464/m.46676 type:complete len:101 (-) Transcript_15464:2005-2307(-)
MASWPQVDPSRFHALAGWVRGSSMETVLTSCARRWWHPRTANWPSPRRDPPSDFCLAGHCAGLVLALTGSLMAVWHVLVQAESTLHTSEAATSIRLCMLK